LNITTFQYSGIRNAETDYPHLLCPDCNMGSGGTNWKVHAEGRKCGSKSIATHGGGLMPIQAALFAVICGESSLRVLQRNEKKKSDS
jgi:hypothetical protein